jgi:hypothetical protein
LPPEEASVVRATLLALIAVFSFLVGFTMPTSAVAQQYVTDTGFCKNVKDLQCIEPIASGDSIDLSELQSDAKGPVLYFWGSVNNPQQSLVVLYFSRQGDCYSNVKSVTGNRAGESSSLWRSAINWARTTTLGDLTSFLFKDAKVEAGADVKGIDLKLTVTIADPSPRSRSYTFRNVTCSGTVQARLMDSHGTPLAPDANNELKSLTITDAKGSADKSGKISALIFN